MSYFCHQSGVHAQANNEMELLSLEIEDAGTFLLECEIELMEIIIKDDPGADSCREILSECWKTIILGRLAGEDGYKMELEVPELTWDAQKFIEEFTKLSPEDYE